MNKNLYAILGVATDADAETIRAAYEAAMAKAHDSDAVRRLALKEAYATLSQVNRRAVYDASLIDAPSRRGAVAAVEATPANKLPWLIGLSVLVIAGGLALRSHKAAPPKKPATVQPIVVTLPRAADTSPAATPNAVAAAPARRALAPEALFALASASVVRVNVYNAAGEAVALGSGVVIEPSTVITNCHVAKAGARLKVKHQAEQYDALVTIADEKHDLCKLSVAGLAAPPVALGTVGSLRVGETVYAIGSPQGLDLTLSNGMVSSLREGPDGTLVQTTAAISPGSSGGGLFNAYGQLVGIVSFQMRSGQNLNFALPVDWVSTMANTVATTEARDAEPSTSANAKSGPASLLLGTWHCFGSLTGRGLDMRIEANGNVSGTADGKPFQGMYTLQGKALSFDNNTFQVEELSESRMVLTKGEGRRLACNR